MSLSKYTTTIRWMITENFKFKLDSYPLFDEEYRPQLNQKILHHFYFYEIGFETAELFNNRLKQKMDEIMPFYNLLYKSALLDLDPITTEKHTISTEKHSNTDMDYIGKVRTSKVLTDRKNSDEHSTDVTSSSTYETEETTGSKNENENGEKNIKQVGSDTPQGLLNLGNIENEAYASTASIGRETNTTTITATDENNAKKNTTLDSNLNHEKNFNESSSLNDDTDNDTNNTQNTDYWETFSQKFEGYNGISPAELLKQYRETFLNIDMMIIKELETLFMGLW